MGTRTFRIAIAVLILIGCSFASQQNGAKRNVLIERYEPIYRWWLEQDARDIITPEEAAAFRLLSNDEQRDQFIEAFWYRRDPTPDTFENEFKLEHYQRTIYANQNFGTVDVPGRNTDRGRVYIVFGPPDQISNEAAASGMSSEKWISLHP